MKPTALPVLLGNIPIELRSVPRWVLWSFVEVGDGEHNFDNPAAFQGLAGKVGAVVAIEPATGRILASVQSPSFDPNKLSSHDPQEIRTYYAALEADPEVPQELVGDAQRIRQVFTNLKAVCEEAAGSLGELVVGLAGGVVVGVHAVELLGEGAGTAGATPPGGLACPGACASVPQSGEFQKPNAPESGPGAHEVTRITPAGCG